VASIAAAASYSLVMGAASVRLARDGVRGRLVFVALAAVHLGYGVGMWAGLIRFAPRWVHSRRGPHERLDVLS
jgi:hypothetical protein